MTYNAGLMSIFQPIRQTSMKIDKEVCMNSYRTNLILVLLSMNETLNKFNCGPTFHEQNFK
jgi:hypothetical protein